MSPMAQQIETARLLLRPTRLEDFDPWATLQADPVAAPFMGGVQPRPVAWRGFMIMAGCWSLLGFGMFSIIEKSSGRWIGRLGPWQPEGWPGTEIGWGLMKDVWGRGYATEGAAAAMEWAFVNLGWTEVIHSIAPENVRSQAVARKLGSRKRGPGRLPPPYEAATVEIWGQTREEWMAARSRSGSGSTRAS
jgi:RimJ/RimL family protein N-acetyltransferase